MTPLTMKQLRAQEVPPRSLTMWYLGQNGFVLKSPDGNLVVIDPYLSNACEAENRSMGVDARRRVPIPIAPTELVGVNIYVLTHSHNDHMDAETIGPYRRAGGAGPFLAPPETCERLEEKLGVPRDQIIMIWPNKTHAVGDLTIRATFAIGWAADDMTHVGYLIAVRDGPTFYFTGDTSFEDLVWMGVKDHHPDVMISVINGAFRNLSPSDAAKLALHINPKIVFPCHYDMFSFNTMDPQMLHTNLMNLGIAEKYRLLEHGKPFTYTLGVPA